MTIVGSCLCGAARYEISQALRTAELCHCSMCRKAHGTAFSANAEVESASFRWVAGEDLLSEFASSPGRRRVFCSRCGSPLAIRRLDDPATLVVTLGSLDADPGTRPSRHVFVDSKAPWDEIGGDLPRFHIYPGFEPGFEPVDPDQGVGATIAGIDHVQLAMPAGCEDEAREFYSRLLGIPEIPKPEHLARRGGVWFESGQVKLHLGVDKEFRPARKAHTALRVQGLRRLVERLQGAGVKVVDDEALAGYDRVYVDDPFGNRLELLEPIG
jgi:catechol 2,3-dioxygenase-like lactoylglutathione lyase family enzyme